MTWVIGTPSFWGYAVAISDIRVTWPNGVTQDCLQKVYPIERFLAAGFAGSVWFGLQSITDMQRYLHLSRADEAWIPGKAILWWYRRARLAFQRAPDIVRGLGAELMILGVSPTVDLGIPGWAKPTVAILRSPDFFPRFLKMNEVSSIGSGGGVWKYIEELEALNKDDDALLKMETSSRGGYARALHIVIHQVIADHPDECVSPHVHMCLLQRGRVAISNSDHATYSSDGPPVPFVMPPIATNWEQFQELSRESGAEAVAAQC